MLIILLLLGVLIIVTVDTFESGREAAQLHFAGLQEEASILYSSKTESKIETERPNERFNSLRTDLREAAFLRSFVLYDKTGRVHYAYGRRPLDIHFATLGAEKYRSTITLNKNAPYDIQLSHTGKSGAHVEAVYRIAGEHELFVIIRTGLITLLVIAVGLAFIIVFYVTKRGEEPSVIYGEASPNRTDREHYADNEPRSGQEHSEREAMEQQEVEEELSSEEFFPHSHPSSYSTEEAKSESFQDESSFNANQMEEEEEEGLYSPRTGFVRKMFLSPRLESELKRAAAFDQDLVLALVRCLEESERDADSTSAGTKPELYDQASTFFPFQDLLFEYDQTSFAVILPNTDLDQGIELLSNFQHHLFETGEPCNMEVAIGLSSRNGRLLDQKRLLTETKVALKKAVDDPETRLVGFRPDPGKYRSFVAQRV